MTKEQRKAWRTANPEKHRAEQRLYYARNKKKVRVRITEYKRTHPEQVLNDRHRRRTRVTQAGGHFTTEQWFELCSAAGFRCLCCRKKRPLEADHIIPVAKGGTSWIWNIQPLCGECNKKKHDKVIDYRFQ
jgi:5-methylcytosine-specific restriction endonuclease McrA